jgi:hypothetical protein
MSNIKPPLRERRLRQELEIEKIKCKLIDAKSILADIRISEAQLK